MLKKKKIAIVSSEFSPWASAGALGDFTKNLSIQLSQLDQEVYVFVPAYPQFFREKLALKKVAVDLTTPVYFYEQKFNLYEWKYNSNLKIILIDDDRYFNRENLYSDQNGINYEDNAERFVFFAKSVLIAIEHMQTEFDVIHCNDWQTGLIPVYAKEVFQENQTLKDVKFVFTIHNLHYKGTFWHYDMPILGLNWRLFNMEGIEFFGKISYLKAGMIFSDLIVTTSAAYQSEALTHEFGLGFEGVLQRQIDKLISITSGFDFKLWNSDYQVFKKKPSLTEKSLLRKKIVSQFSLHPNQPICLFPNVLIQKHKIKNINHYIKVLIDLNLQVVCSEKNFMNLSDELKDSESIVCHDDKTNSIYELIAGTDFVFLPFENEPYNLNHLIGMKWGTLPLAFRSGFFVDTVCPMFEGQDFQQDNGILFSSVDEFQGKLKHLLKFWKLKKNQTELRKKLMHMKSDWKETAREYLKHY